MADFLQNAEGLIPLLMLGGLFAGGKRKSRRSGNSGGGFLSMLLAQQAKRNESEMQQAARQEELRQQFLGKLLAEGVANGATIPEGLLSQAGVFGVTPEMYEQMRKDRFAKGVAQTIATLAPYAKDQETLDALRNIGNYGSLNEYLTSQRGVEAERGRQLAEVILHQMKSGEAVKAAAGLGPNAAQGMYESVFKTPETAGAGLGHGLSLYDATQDNRKRSIMREAASLRGTARSPADKQAEEQRKARVKLWDAYTKEVLALAKEAQPVGPKASSGVMSLFSTGNESETTAKALRDRSRSVLGTYYPALKEAGLPDEKILAPFKAMGVKAAGRDAIGRAMKAVLTPENNGIVDDAPLGMTETDAADQVIRELEESGYIVTGY